jgi:8-oxo-dGTP diphosphatase
VLVVHRPRYDDWSLPKGKLGPGESEADAAMREVLEETGFSCELGQEIGQISYFDRDDVRKVVRYWEMRPVSGSFAPNDEVDDARWVSIDEALDLLSYERDRALVRAWRERIRE